MTGPDQRDKDPEPADKWVNAVKEMKMNPDRNPRLEEDLEGEWDVEPEGLQERVPDAEQDGVSEEGQADKAGKTNCPDIFTN